jgi:hypothetical protein
VSPPSAAAAPAVNPRRVAPGRPFPAAPRPRRVSGPARPLGDRPARSRQAGQAGIALGLLEAVSRLSEHRLLDRLIRGRIWIALVAFALIGIVTLQLGLLKLNAGIGHALARETSLQRENAALSIENSELAAGDLVESSAARLGMEMVPVAALRFLTASPRADAAHGAAALNTPVTSGSSSSSGAESSTGASSAEAGASSPEAEGTPAQASESPSSTSSSTSESEAAKSGESSAPAVSEASGERSSSTAATPSAPGGSAEASGGTQAGTSGR